MSFVNSRVRVLITDRTQKVAALSSAYPPIHKTHFSTHVSPLSSHSLFVAWSTPSPVCFIYSPSCTVAVSQKSSASNGGQQYRVLTSRTGHLTVPGARLELSRRRIQSNHTTHRHMREDLQPDHTPSTLVQLLLLPLNT